LLPANKAANAVSTRDNFEFLEDVVPKTVPYKKIKSSALETQARLRGNLKIVAERPAPQQVDATGSIVNGGGTLGAFTVPLRMDDRAAEDPNDQLETEMRQATGNGDVSMTG
jgi:hypothetical protein